jgi:hypothetical protein
MESIHEDPISYYKRLEAEMNKTIQSPMNCRAFTKAFGKAMDAHLRRVRIHRSLTTRWLNHLDIPNKDELAAISIRMVDCVEKLDFSDETIYFINKRQKENHKQLKLLQKAFEELLAILQEEAKEIKGNKLKSLENDLKDLQQLFF